MSLRGKGKKAAIVGFSKTSYDDVPWDNPGFEKISRKGVKKLGPSC